MHNKKVKKHRGIRNAQHYKRNQILWGFALLAPSILGLSLFYIYPFFENVYNSFVKISLIGNKTWVGLDNYKTFFSDPKIGRSFLYTFQYTAVTVTVTVILSILVATALNQKIRGVNFYRIIFYLPVVAMPVAIAVVWRWMFNFEFGVVNEIIKALNGSPIPWLQDKNVFFISLVIVSAWGRVGFNVLLLLAGLQNIPAMYYDAAMVDGAGATRRFLRITLPLLSPIIFFVIVINVINFLQVFDWIIALTNLISGVGAANSSVITLFYQYAFRSNQKGVASAVSVVFFAVILLVTILQFRLQKKWVHYEK